MKTIFHFGLLISLSLLIGCGQDAGTADVQGLPALKADPNAEKGGGSSGPSFSMKVDPTKMMMGRLDANGDGRDEGRRRGGEPRAMMDFAPVPG